MDSHKELIRGILATHELERTVPAGRVAESGGPGDPAALLPDEKQYHRGAVQKRAEEFAAGRACAHRLLAEFGIVDFPVKVAADRQPLWPEGLVGSITHTSGFCEIGRAGGGE